jgi:DNA-binding protein HU-beta
MAKANDKKAAKAPAKAAPQNAPMNRGDVIDTIAAQVGLTRTQADDAMKAYEGAIQRALSTGGEVRLAGFGSFKTSARAARQGRNPQTGQPVKIAASTAVRFVPSSALKTAVNGKKAAKAPAKAAKAPAKAPAKKGKK